MAWLKDEQCAKVVEDAWVLVSIAKIVCDVMDKLGVCATKLEGWNNSHFKCLQKQRQENELKLKFLLEEGEGADRNAINLLQREILGLSWEGGG